jgi:hypothetical protein
MRFSRWSSVGFADAGVEMPFALAREHVAAGFGSLEGEGRAHVDRRVQRALFVLRVIAVVDGAGGKGFLVLGHGWPLSDFAA